MAKRWVLIPEAVGKSVGARVPVGDEKLKHLRKVLRMEWGDSVQLLDGKGRVFSAKFLQHGPSAEFEIEELIERESAQSSIELVLGLAKNATMDWVIEKAVECGATRITPVVFSRSVVRPHADDLEKYERRWQAIIDSAVEQSEQRIRPEIGQPVSFDEWMLHSKNFAGAKILFSSETRESATDHDLISTTAQTLSNAIQAETLVVIGPEGGFTDSERQHMFDAGFLDASLGKTVLRVETATIAALMWLKLIRHMVR